MEGSISIDVLTLIASPLISLIAVVVYGSYYRGTIDVNTATTNNAITKLETENDAIKIKIEYLATSATLTEDKVKTLRGEIDDMPNFCHNQRASILEDLRRELPLIIANSMQESMIANLKQINSVTINVAVMKKDIRAIFKILDRRNNEPSDPYIIERRIGRDDDDVS